MANLNEANGIWTLEGSSVVVTSVAAEPELRILASDEEGHRWDFSLGAGDGTPAADSTLQSLVGREVSKLVVSAGGELRLEFRGGRVLRVSPRHDVEAWEIRRDGEWVLIADTGGGVIAF